MKIARMVTPLFIAMSLAQTCPIGAGIAFANEPSERVIRHAVFFSFKASSSEADVQAVVDAFQQLPKQIDSIIDFKWGKANPDAKLADGFSHAFLLTFKDEQGRETYLPHPAHKAFGDLLRPHMKDVFVVDYWGTSSSKELESELKHAVFFKFRENAGAEEIKTIEEGFAALPAKISTVMDFEWGRNNSPETHDDGFTHCFMVTFVGPEGLKAYNPHPEHQEFVKTLGPVEAIRVIDFAVQK